MHFLTTAVLATLLAVPALAQTSCSASSKCSSDTPCCSQYGQCGTGAYCLGGCDPKSSFSLDSCVPEPVCESKNYDFTSLNGLTSNTKYLGDSSTTDWVSSGEPVEYDNSLLLTLAQGTAGTVLASSTYVWYGKISATMKTSRGAGVVTAFILLSDMKDEIDCEFVGADLQTLQTNYYFQGVLDYDNEYNVSLSDTFANWHTYEIDWTPDTITWYVDGQVGRVKNRNETWNATTNQYHFPQTPARIELSIWPAGEESNGEGTIAWAGGLIDWSDNSPDIKNNGYYYAMVQSVNVTCYDPPSGANVQGNTSYIYTSDAGTNDTVEITDKPTVLKSLLGTGTNMSADYASAASSGTASAAATSDAAVVPGISGPGVVPGQSDAESSASSASSATATQAGASASSTSASGFSQGGTSVGSSSEKSDASFSMRRTMHGSGFAALVLVLAIVAL